MSRILVSYSSKIPTASLICHLMSKVKNEYGCETREIAVVDVLTKDIEWAEVILFVRPFEVGAYRIIEAGKRANKKIVVYLDDDLLNLPEIYPNMVRKALTKSLYSRNCEYLIKSLKMCDVLWGSNPFLLEKYSKYVENGRCEISDVAYDFDHVVSPVPCDGEFKILFAGNGDHVKYLNDFIIPSINNLVERKHSISFTCIGIDPGALDKCRGKTEYIPWVRDFDEYNRLIMSRQFDLGVAPIMNDDFHRCKYVNKFIEYSRYGIVGVYSNDYPYKMVVVDGYNGLLADNNIGSWTDKLEYAIEHTKKCKDMINNAQELCHQKFSVKQMTSSVYEKIPELFNDVSDYNAVKYYPTWFMNHIRKYVTVLVEKHEYIMTQKNIKKDSASVLLVYAGYTTTTELLESIVSRATKKNNVHLAVRESTIVTAKDIRDADTVIFCRGADPYMARIAEAAKKAHRTTVLYLDDDLYGVYKGTLYGEALLKCLTNCDILWASNPHIYDKYKDFAPEVKFVEGKVFDPIDNLFDMSYADGEYSILYAGSPSHIEIIQKMIVPALNEVSKSFNQFRAVFIGFKEESLSGCKFKTKYLPWSKNMDDYRKMVIASGCHIGLAVIKDDEFGNCKYYNKYLEYSRMGIAGVYSNVIPYQLVVKDSVNGLIVDNTSTAWASGILQLLKNEDKRQQIIKNAQEDLRRNFNVEEVVDKLVVDMPELCAYHAPDIRVRYHTNRLLHQLNFIWRKHIASRF